MFVRSHLDPWSDSERSRIPPLMSKASDSKSVRRCLAATISATYWNEKLTLLDC